MVSCYGSDLTPYDWTIELAPPQPNKPFKYQKDTLMEYIAGNENYSKFFYLLKKGATAPLLNSLAVNYTVFLPSDIAIQNTFGNYTDNVIMNIDKYTAKELYYIIFYQCLRH